VRKRKWGVVCRCTRGVANRENDVGDRYNGNISGKLR